MFLGHADQSQGILGETGAAVTGAGVQEFPAYTPIQPHAFGDGVHIGTYLLTQL